MNHCKMEHPQYPLADFSKMLSKQFGTPVPQAQATRLYRRWIHTQRALKTFATTHEEVLRLSNALNWRNALHIRWSLFILDPCAGTGAITSYLHDELSYQEIPIGYHRNDLSERHEAETHYDAILPLTWRCLPKADVIIASPPFEIADAIIAQAAQNATLFAAFHVFGDFITNGPTYRRRWWSSLEAEDRATQVHGLPLIAERPCRRCIWVVVFTNAMVKRKIWARKENVITVTECLTRETNGHQGTR